MSCTNYNNSFKKYFLLFYKPYKLYIICFLFCSTLLGLNGFVNYYLIKKIINLLVESNNQSFSFKTIFWPATFLVIYIEIYSISWRAIDYIRLKSFPTIKSEIINYLFNYLHKQSLSFFQKNYAGSIANNINILTENTEKIASILFTRILRGIIQVSVAFISMYSVHPIFAIALIIWATLFILISYIYSQKMISLAAVYAKSYSNVSGRIVDSITNFINVKLFARSEFESLNLSGTLSNMKEDYQKKEWFLLKFHYLQGLSITLLIGFMTYMLIQLKIKNQVTIGDFAFILGLSFHVTEYVWTLTEYIDQIHDSIGKCKQSIKDIFQPIDIKDKKNASKLSVLKGEITFENVSFQYKDTEPIFRNESVTIKSGHKVGLVGYSGVGKTTFSNLLLRLYDVNTGRILIDNQDISCVTQDSLHNSIGVIPQDPLLFHRTIMENIRYGNPNAQDREVIEAAKKANIHDFIESLPRGYYTLVGERGVKLSGGQKQRIALAMVILKNPPILILDEATSHLDSIAENTIMSTLYKFMLNKTVIIIAHRLSTLLHMNNILVFDKGKIVENGTHSNLLQKGGLYSRLWSAQINRSLPNNE